MEIFPAIDLKNGQCVRLSQGDFGTAKIYEKDPLLQMRKFSSAGASWLHVVDLDGAREGEMKQIDLITNLAKQTPLRIQAGGGIRGARTIHKLLDSGVARVVIGSLAIRNKALVKKWLRQFEPQRIVIAFDVKIIDDHPVVLTHGWQNNSQQLLWDVLDAYEDSGLKHILCTDVSRDGMLTGANADLYKSILDHAPKLKILASGGVKGLKDLVKLAKVPVAGAVVGKAIYEGRVDLAKALREVKHAR
jgi:phosphoribosylformimino-5-aminoimidazole carboxamide ribotide isomerase